MQKHQLKMVKRCQGFTIFEIAIVLAVSALLMGAALKGQQMIDIAKEKRLESEFQAIPRMIDGYLDRYKAIPGDDINAVRRFSNLSASARNGDGEGLIHGNWFDKNLVNDNTIVWQHLRFAGFMDGEVDPSSPGYFPQNVLGYAIDIQSGKNDVAKSPIIDAHGLAMNGRYILCSRGIPGELALSLDIRLDDGNPAQGKMLATPDAGEFRPGAYPATIGTHSSSDISSEKQYVVCMSV